MFSYLKAENLKLKHTLLKKLIFLFPIFCLIPAKFVGYCGFAASMLNYWCIFILPVVIPVFCGLINQKEIKYHKYRLVYSLPINLKKIWIAKNLLCIFYLFLSALFITIITCLINRTYIVYNIISTENLNIFIGFMIIFLTTLWQVPLCMALTKKFGLISITVANLILNMILTYMDITNSSYFWLSPYAWGARILCTTNHVMVNGLEATDASLYLSTLTIILLCFVSTIICAAITCLTANRFTKLEAK